MLDSLKDVVFGRSGNRLQTLNPLSWFDKALFTRPHFEKWDSDYLVRMKIGDPGIGRIDMPVSYRLGLAIKGAGVLVVWSTLATASYHALKNTTARYPMTIPYSATPATSTPAAIEERMIAATYHPVARKDREIARGGLPNVPCPEGPI